MKVDPVLRMYQPGSDEPEIGLDQRAGLEKMPGLQLRSAPGDYWRQEKEFADVSGFDRRFHI